MNRSMRFNEQIQSDKKPLNPNLEFWCTLPAPWRPLLPPPSLPPLPAGVWIQHATSLSRKICLVRQQHRRRPSPGLVEPLPFLRIVQPLCSRYWKWVCLSWTFFFQILWFANMVFQIVACSWKSSLTLVALKWHRVWLKMLLHFITFCCLSITFEKLTFESIFGLFIHHYLARYWKWVCLSWTWRLWLVAIFTNISIRFFVLSWTLQILVYTCWTKKKH